MLTHQSAKVFDKADDQADTSKYQAQPGWRVDGGNKITWERVTRVAGTTRKVHGRYLPRPMTLTSTIAPP